MNDKDDLKGLPALDIFVKLFEKTFHCSLTGDTVTDTSSKVIDPKHLSLLLAWPGILEMELAAITGNNEYKQQLDALRNLLDGEAEYPQIRDCLDNLIEPKPVPTDLLMKARKAQKSGNNKKLKTQTKKIRRFFPKIFETLIFLLHSKTMHMESQWSRLAFLFGSYHTLCCMIANDRMIAGDLIATIDRIKTDGPTLENVRTITTDSRTIKLLEKKKGEAYITEREMQNILKKCETENKLNIYAFSKLLMEVLFTVINKDLNFFISFNIKQGEYDVPITNPIKASSAKMNLYEIKIPQKHTYAFVERYGDSANSIDEAIRACGMALNMNPFENFEYDLWYLMAEKEAAGDKSWEKAFLFLDPKGTGKKTLSNIMFRLCQIAKESSLTIQSIINSWENFVESPANAIKPHADTIKSQTTDITKSHKDIIELRADIIKPQLDKIIKKTLELLKDYETREEFFSYKALSRAIFSLDAGIDDKDFNNMRLRILTYEKKHIGPGLLEILTEANIEITDILNNVKKLSKEEKIKVAKVSKTKTKTRIKKLNKEELKKIAKKYWKENQFEHIIYQDVDFLEYASDPNLRRLGRGSVLKRVAERHGKIIPPSEILIRLGYPR